MPVPLGREDVHGIDDVAAAAEWIRASRPSATAVVVKHDDSGAGDGNLVVDLRDDSGAPLDPHQLLADIAALPAWFLDDLAAGGGVVEELVTGDRLRSPSVQVDLLPGGGVRVLATHDQVLGGANGQVYLGCRFPADPAYAADLARFGHAVGSELAARGCVGRAGVDVMAARSGDAPWSLTALEVNLRKGGTTHPFSALRSLVPGHYDSEAGSWLADADGSARAYRSTDNFVDPTLAERSPQSVIDAVREAGLQFDAGPGHRRRAAHARLPRGRRALRGHRDRPQPGARGRALRGDPGRRRPARGRGRGGHPLRARHRRGSRLQSTDAIRRTASSRMAGDVAKFSRAKPRPCARPYQGPDPRATRPRSRKTAAGSSPSPRSRQSSQAR